MQFIRPGININFMGYKKIFMSLSGALILISIILLLWRGGPNYGVDFTGGVVIQVKLDKKQSPSDIREALDPIGLGDSMIQAFGEARLSEYLIRVSDPDIKVGGLGEKVKEALAARFGQGVEIRRVEMVGPKLGEDLRRKALMAIYLSILLIGIYISGRFEHKWLISAVMAACLLIPGWVAFSLGAGITWLIIIALVITLGLCWFLKLKWALGAIFCLVHDVIITVGAFALTDREISLTVIAGLLTIVGYSLNDTIIVFDRIRENLGRYRNRPMEQLMNASMNETLSRTILTSGTTLVVVLALFILGGAVIHDFAFAMLIGIVAGTYSSIYVASPFLLLWESKTTQSGKNSRSQG
jgi:preprotein translocase subunit SecF